jgi:hypothetical protein
MKFTPGASDLLHADLMDQFRAALDERTTLEQRVR